MSVAIDEGQALPLVVCRAPGATLSTLGCFLSLTKINWGIGMMAMPYYLHLAGPCCGLIFFATSMCLAADSALCLVRIREEIPRCSSISTYAALVKSMLGRWGESGAIFSMLISNFGAAVAWIKYIGDNLHRFLPEVAFPGSAWCLAVTILLLFCAAIENVGPLTRISGVGLFAGQAFVGVIVAAAAGHWRHFAQYLYAQPLVNWSGLPVAMGIAVFCNEGMVILTPSVHAGMRDTSRYPRALMAMTLYFSVNYLLVAFSGDFLFSYISGGVVDDQASLSFGVSPLYRAAVYLYLAQLFLTFPLLWFALFSSFEAAYMPNVRRRFRVTMRVSFILCAGVLAVVVPNFGDCLALIGGLGNSMGIYILPHLCLLQAGAKGEINLSNGRRCASLIVVGLFGVVVGAISTVVSFDKLLT